MSDPVKALADALRADDAGRAAELLDSASDAMEARKQRHMGYQPLAIQTRRQTAPESDLRSACTTLLGQGTVAAQAHAELGMKLAGYFEGEVTGTAAAQAARAATQAHESFETARETVASASVDVGPVLAIFGPTKVEHPKGVPLEETFDVTNLGTGSTAELSTSAKSRLSLTATPASLDPLEPDRTKTLTLSGTPTQDGGFSVSLAVTGDSVGDEQSVQVVVLSKADYLERAIASINGLIDQLEPHVEDDGSGGGSNGNNGGGKNQSGNGLLAKLRTARSRLEQLLTRVENGRTGPSVDNKIQSVQQQLGAFSNHVSAQRGKALPDGTAVRVLTDAEAIIEQLASARQAST